MISVSFSSGLRIKPEPVFHRLAHNLPLDSADLFVVDFLHKLAPALRVLVVGSELRLAPEALDQSLSYKLVAFAVRDGVQPGVWWVDDYVYDPGQRNIEFTSQGSGGDSGPTKSITSTITINGQPAQRTVVATALDGGSPRVLGMAQSDANGQYTVSWQGYTGQVLLTAMDDYGVPHVAGEARGVGERIHPSSPNGYVYEVASAGTLGAEPAWPAEAGALVTSGSVQLVAKPFYRPKTHGPITVV